MVEVSQYQFRSHELNRWINISEAEHRDAKEQGLEVRELYVMYDVEARISELEAEVARWQKAAGDSILIEARVIQERNAIYAVSAEQADLLMIFQSWLGADRDKCDATGRKLWDRIEATKSGHGLARVQELEQALLAVVNEFERNVCRHEETHRGGAIWTICDGCGCQWADDRGGFQPYQDPPAIKAAYELLKGVERKA